LHVDLGARVLTSTIFALICCRKDISRTAMTVLIDTIN
jgi:hypothetical protein